MRLRLVVPADVEVPTGGNVYDLALAAALRRGGDEVVVERCAPSRLDPLLRHPWSGPTLVDGLLAGQDPAALTGSPAAVLVHLPLGLETGLPARRAAELDALEGQSLRAATAVVVTSSWAAEELLRRHGLRDVAVAAPGVDRASVSAGSQPPLLVQLAALVPRKDQLGTLAALAEVADLSWSARLAGPDDRDAAYAGAVRRAVDDAGLTGRVQVPGPLPRDDAWEGADLALLPSRAETFGMVVTEALARGVPAVVSEGGAVEALGHVPGLGRPGVVVPVADPPALAAALRRWLVDVSHRDALRVSARARRGMLTGWDVTAAAVRQALTDRA